MEKRPIPQADRLVGATKISLDNSNGNEGSKITVDTKEVLTKFFNKISPDKKPFENLELEKTERDRYIIHIATEAVKKFAEQYGRKNFTELPEDNIHYLKEGGVSKYTEERIEIGSHATVLGQVLIDRRSDLQTALTTFHELWHTLGSYEAIQVTTKDKIDWYRSGFGIKSRDGTKEYFYPINEALTGIMTKRFFEEVLAMDSSFQDEIEKIKTLGEEVDTSRQREVKTLQELAENIYKKNQHTFESPEDVINLFLKGQVTGNIMPIARVIENTFGKGVFRKLGEAM